MVLITRFRVKTLIAVVKEGILFAGCQLFFLENLLFKLFFSYLPNTINGLSFSLRKILILFSRYIVNITRITYSYNIMFYSKNRELRFSNANYYILRLLSKPTIYFIVCFNLGTTPLVIPIHLIINHLLIKI